jgi:hypothetical protein
VEPGTRRGLYLGTPVFMPDHIPARTVAEVRKQRVNACLGFWPGVVIFDSAVLFVNRVVRLDCDSGKLIAAGWNPVADRNIVSGVGGTCQENNSSDNPEK